MSRAYRYRHNRSKQTPIYVALGVLAALSFGLVLLIGFAMISRPGEKEQTKKKRSEPPIFTASEIMAAYDLNALRADAQFEDKRLRVSGTVGTINDDILGTPFVTLNTDNPIFSVQCMFDTDVPKELLELSPGDEVTVRGVCRGAMGNVIIEQSVLLSVLHDS